NASPHLKVADTPRDSVALFQYTSGTTGDPKGVMHTHRGIVYSTDTYFRHVLNLHEGDICFSLSKIFFGFGQGNSIWGPLRWGASVLLYPGIAKPKKVFHLVEKYGVTVLFAAPTHYRKMVQSEDIGAYNLGSLRLCVSAGEPLPSALYNRWKEQTNIEILDGIGSTEAMHIFISNKIGEVKPGTSGRPVAGYEAKVVDQEGNEVPPGEPGNLMVKGGSIAVGYWNKYEETKNKFIGWWLSTGDIYLKDEEGYFTYQGRADDMIRSGGVWVSPVEVEETLKEHPAVTDAAAIPGKTREGLLRVKALVVLAEGYEPSEDLKEELKGFVKSKIAPYKKPTWIEFVNDLPRTSTGKLMRYKLRKREERLWSERKFTR
ncbi:MAG: benzoate-CoA ligase family protein, partial [Candidatus Baldrarchaeia archaeon]